MKMYIHLKCIVIVLELDIMVIYVKLTTALIATATKHVLELISWSRVMRSVNAKDSFLLFYLTCRYFNIEVQCLPTEFSM